MAREAVLHRVNPYLLHGEQYYQLLYSYANQPDITQEARVAHTNIYPDPKEGDTVLIEAVLNIITKIERK